MIDPLLQRIRWPGTELADAPPGLPVADLPTGWGSLTSLSVVRRNALPGLWCCLASGSQTCGRVVETCQVAVGLRNLALALGRAAALTVSTGE